MNVRIKLFAVARDLTGTDAASLSVPEDATAGVVMESLLQQYPRLRDWENFLRVAVNWEYVSLDEAVHANDEIAIIPPVSGG